MRSAMKILASMLFCVLVACGGGSKTSPANTSTSAKPDQGDGAKCTQEILLSCPDGQIDQCIKERAASDAKIKEMESKEGDEAGGTGTAMALDEGRISEMTHKCVPN
jgi:hypothetical protein